MFRRNDRPSGFGYVSDTPPGAGRATSRGVTTNAAVVIAVATAAITTTGRHRGDGTAPVGNSSSMNPIAITAGTNTVSETTPTTSAAGSDRAPSSPATA